MGFKPSKNGQCLKKISKDKNLTFEIWFRSSVYNSSCSVAIYPLITITCKNLKKWVQEENLNVNDDGLVYHNHIGYLSPINQYQSWDLAGLSYAPSIKTNTDLALGSAKELLEIVCKSILSEKKISYTDDMTLSKLFKETINSVGILESSSASNKEQADRSIRQILSGLNSVIQGVSELRNGYGSGHGKEASFKRLEPQYVEFVVSIVSNIVVFILQINGETTPLQN